MKIGSILGQVWRYFKYFLRAKSGSSNLSPFVRDLAAKVINSKKEYYAFDEIDGVRSMLEKNDTSIQITDLGAGSHLNKNRTRLISDIAKNSAKSRKIGQVLTKLCDYVQPKYCLELGTSLGISTLYQYSASKKAKWVTMEGCPETAAFAKKVFSSYKANNIEVVVGDFGETLVPTVEKLPQIDYAFFDGNHQKQATIDYFEQCLKKANNDSLFVFDDIHWSKGMEEAWEYIKEHPRVTVSIDLFYIGLVCFKTDQQKEHYTMMV